MIGIDTVIRFKDGHLIKHYLLASYCYYHLDQSPMTDPAFDHLCVRLAQRWDAIDDNIHPQKKLINKDDVDAGTCLLKETDFPGIVRHNAPDYAAYCASDMIHAQLEEHLMPRTLPAPVSAKRILRTSPVVSSVAPTIVPAAAAFAPRIIRTMRSKT